MAQPMTFRVTSMAMFVGPLGQRGDNSITKSMHIHFNLMVTHIWLGRTTAHEAGLRGAGRAVIRTAPTAAARRERYNITDCVTGKGLVLLWSLEFWTVS